MTRRKNDAYNSPGWVVKALFDFANIYPQSLVLEPCCGDCSLAIPMQNMGCIVFTNDIDPNTKAQRHKDYLKFDLSEWRTDKQPTIDWLEDGHTLKPDWVITNPPFGLAFPMLQKAIEEATVGVAFLLRISFLEPTNERGEWLEQNPPNGLLYLPRISFTGDGKTDSTTVAWMIWLKRLKSMTRIGVASKATMNRYKEMYR